MAISDRRHQAWLERSVSWHNLQPASDWKARKVLGKGSFGVTGHWQYVGNDPVMPKDIVVKQSHGKNAKDLIVETKMLRALAATGSPHIVKLYRGCHREGGTGTSTYDILPYAPDGTYDVDREIARMYLEFVPGGDCNNFYERVKKDPQFYIPEEHVWSILHCLAKACLVLLTGSEDASVPDPFWTRPILHFDIKPANILIGDRDASEHSRLEIFKLADFGIACFEETLTKRKAEDWVKAVEWRATPTFMSPEQYHKTHVNRDISSQTNIWMAGAVIHQLITVTEIDIKVMSRHVPDVGPAIIISGDPTQRLYKTSVCPYSSTLIDTICRCIAYDPADRITPSALVLECQRILTLYSSRARPISPTSLTTENLYKFNILPSPSFTRQNNKPPIGGVWGVPNPKKDAGVRDLVNFGKIEELSPEGFYGPFFPDSGPVGRPLKADYLYKILPQTPRPAALGPAIVMVAGVKRKAAGPAAPGGTV
ncbi:kinase-like protein [Acephala macrosclerotiorum]|nr:kinase-like protein [Acephala macrosclerotiorum]